MILIELRAVGSLAAMSFMVAPISWADTLCPTPALAIPDNTAVGVSDSIVLTAGDLDELTDMNVSIDTSHTWVGDLVFTLEHEGSGISVVIIDRPGEPLTGFFGCQNDDIDATLDDSANTPVEDECSAIPPAIGGTHRPNSPLSAFNGTNRGGTWTLTASDNSQDDTGTLNAWCLTFTFTVVDDSDGDGVADNADNCTFVANPAQRDTNGDGFGNFCDADLNNDCVVNIIDLGLFRSRFFTSDPDADFNGNGIVNALDLSLLGQLFFEPPGPSSQPNACDP